MLSINNHSLVLRLMLRTFFFIPLNFFLQVLVTSFPVFEFLWWDNCHQRWHDSRAREAPGLDGAEWRVLKSHQPLLYSGGCGGNHWWLVHVYTPTCFSLHSNTSRSKSFSGAWIFEKEIIALHYRLPLHVLKYFILL